MVLVGGGHSHLEVLRRAIESPSAAISLTLVSAARRQHYSGMVPGFLAGAYREGEIAFDLASLAGRARAQFVEDAVVSIDPHLRRLRLARGEPIAYDLVSFAVGSAARGASLPGVRAHAWSVKPIGRAVALGAALSDLASSGAAARVVVVGAGAGGVEVACAAAALLERAGTAGRVTVLESGDEILAGYSPRFRRRARGVLERKGFSILLRASVAEVDKSAVRLDDGRAVPSDLTIWVTGPSPPEVFAGSGLAVEDGYLLVDDSLRSVTDPRVFGAGDCATLASRRGTPRAGVYAVREGPVLWRSLVAAVEGTGPPSYSPQRSFLSILNTADGRALLRYGAVVSWSRWAWRLKDAIDRRFMRRYQSLYGDRGGSMP